MAGDIDPGIVAAFQKALEENTLSLKASEAITKIREENQALKGQIQGWETRKEVWDKETVIKNSRISELNTELERVKKELAALQAREKNLIQNETEKAVALGQIGVVREFMGLVFRNLEVRQYMMGQQVPPSSSNPNYYPPPTVPVTENVTKTVG